MDSIDLRSDTVTWPTPAMREAMAEAPLGDDVKGEDPTVNQLEALAAQRLGKEAALFVSSGTQGNLIAVLTHCTRGDEAIMSDGAHIYLYEAGGMAALGGVFPHLVPLQRDGTLRLEDIRAAIREDDPHFARTRLVCLENTQGAVGGIPITAEYTRQVRALCDEFGLSLHIDGARIWNAAAALNCDVAELAAPADSVSFCLSKGLCAPVGSLLVGSADFITRARRVRKLLGGGMRQAGVIAAAGIIAIEEMAPRLHEDHATARRLAQGLAGIPGIELDMAQVQSNMVFFSLAASLPIDAIQLAAETDRLAAVKLDLLGPREIRAVTHYWISPEKVDRAVDLIRTVLEKARA